MWTKESGFSLSRQEKGHLGRSRTKVPTAATVMFLLAEQIILWTIQRTQQAGRRKPIGEREWLRPSFRTSSEKTQRTSPKGEQAETPCSERSICDTSFVLACHMVEVRLKPT